MRTSPSGLPLKDSPSSGVDNKPIYLKFNKFDGDCRYGPHCGMLINAQAEKGTTRCPDAQEQLGHSQQITAARNQDRIFVSHSYNYAHANS